MSLVSGCPEAAIDLWTDEALVDPYPLYKELRDLGPVVWLSSHDLYALPRYEGVHEALEQWQAFSSAHGVMMNEHVNETMSGIMLCSDPPLHRTLRSIAGRPLLPRELQQLEQRLTEQAERAVDQVVCEGRFDAIELASVLPLVVVSGLVGLLEEGRERMIEWANANFTCFGPMNGRTKAALPVLEEAMAYSTDPSLPTRLTSGGWAARLYEAAANGEITDEQAAMMLNDYWAPSLDTTILATASAIRLFGENPDQWDTVRANPRLIASAINEVVRLESPIQMFSRLLLNDYELGGVPLAKGARVVVMYASANRDERKYDNPERFDVTRKPTDHLGFGFGEHHCLGAPLARLEMKALLTALLARVRRFELGQRELLMNNVLHGLRRLEVTIK